MAACSIDVVGIGNAIVDVFADVDDAFVEARGLHKGTMSLVDAVAAGELHREMPVAFEASGGSAANTMVGLASLGGTAAFIGKVRDDAVGDVFRRDIRASGVAFDTPASGDGPSTARCLVLVTPDAQRTMCTFLGACVLLGPDDVDEAVVAAARVTYLEGYLWDPPAAKQAFLAAAAVAHAAGRSVALSLSDPFCVVRHRDSFADLVRGHVDVLFANEDEILALYDAADVEAAVAEARRHCGVVVVTRGARGAVAADADAVVAVPAEPVARVVDTTGAGDLFASGFLFGLTRGLGLEACARLGAIAAAEIVSHHGARPRSRLAELARPVLEG